MSLVKVKTRGEVTLPSALRERAGLNVGDLLEAKFEKGKITLTPKSLIDRRIEEGLEDIRRGRTYGPFDTADQMIESLQRNMKERAKAKKTKRSR
jgi:bifunctional DNA-binding transcriptional regulator/antitoxin component of YhaV-PrlF toxin-antitoxin module